MNSDPHVHMKIKSSSIEATGISDTGCIRSENEDSIFLDKDGQFVLLADGMGGHERGEEASQTTLEIVKEFLGPETISEQLQDITDGSGIPLEIACLLSLVDRAVSKANSVLYERNQKEGIERFMGTTVVGLVQVTNDYLLWFHVGDSRIYRWSDSRLSCITEDHSVYFEWVKKGRIGEEPPTNVITRAIGPKPAVSPDVEWGMRQPGDIYILCSDGLTDMISENYMARILMDEDQVDDIAIRMIDGAKNAGGKDNVSVVVCRV